MLNGLDPIIIFNFSKLLPDLQESVASIPIVSKLVDKVGLPPIPVYLSRQLTGIIIQSEDKNIDIETKTESKTDGTEPEINQKALANTVTIVMQANKNSLGVTLLSALADQIFTKVTSKEYTVDYLHGAVTVFNGLLHRFSINQNADNTLYDITLELSRGGGAAKTVEPPGPPVVNKVSGAVPL